MQYLKQGTTNYVIFGPLIDASDGITPINPVIQYLDMYYSASGGSLVQMGPLNGDPFSRGMGYYRLKLVTTDLTTAGPFRIMCNVAGALPCWEDFTILASDTWDELHSLGLADAVWEETASEHNTAGTMGHTVNSYGDGIGANAELIVAESPAGVPQDGVEVWVSTDQAGTNVVAQGYTDAFGQVTLYLDNGTYYVNMQKSGHTFAQGVLVSPSN